MIPLPLFIAALTGISLLSTALALRLRPAALSAAELDSLRESEDRLRRAQRLGRMGWWRTDVATGMTEMSDELHRIFQVAPGDELTMDYFIALCHEDDRESMVEDTQKSVMEGKQRDINFRICLPDGTVRMCMSRAEPGRDENGRVAYLHGFTQDVTE
jgi:PAS domain S-box-containing protein